MTGTCAPSPNAPRAHPHTRALRLPPCPQRPAIGLVPRDGPLTGALVFEDAERRREGAIRCGSLTPRGGHAAPRLLGDRLGKALSRLAGQLDRVIDVSGCLVVLTAIKTELGQAAQHMPAADIYALAEAQL